MIFLSFSIYFCVNSVIISIFHSDESHDERRLKWEGFNFLTQMLLPIVLSIVISTILGYIMGAIRLGLRSGHLYFLDQSERIKALKDPQERVKETYALEDEYESIRAKWSFLYYVLGFILFIGLNIVSIGFQLEFHVDYKLVWLLNVFICTVIEMGILDTIYTVIGSAVPVLGNILKVRGFYYEYELHERFVNLEADD